jgi:CheY-like chemotaxis protein
MKPICRLLLIEDDNAEAQSIERRCCPDPDSAAIDVVADVRAAEDALAEHEYDLVICDLALPADERKFDPEVGEGLRLFRLIRERAAGTPVIILSGNLSLQILQGFLKDSRSDDIYGRRTEEPLVQAFAKEELPNCIDAVQTHIARIKTLDTLEIDGEVALSVSDARALRIYGRRLGAARATVEPLAGGLSNSRTLKVSYGESDGTATGRVVVKLGALGRVLKEADRYHSVEAIMPVGLGAHVLDVVRAGAGQRGALIYQLADEYTESVFGLIQSRNPLAVTAVQRLAERMKPWVAAAPVVVRTLAHVRRRLITDDDVSEAGAELPTDRELELPVRETRAHGDLHGLNVLVNAKGDPTLIDYGEVMHDANAALDPVTLELSIVYHPEMIGCLDGWPSHEQARSWRDIDAYCAGCPVEDFVRACRTWALAVTAGEEELLASAYAYSMRQLKYKNSAAELAQTVTAGCFTVLAEGHS